MMLIQMLTIVGNLDSWRSPGLVRRHPRANKNKRFQKKWDILNIEQTSMQWRDGANDAIMTAGNVSTKQPKIDKIIECYCCHQNDGHILVDCPDSDVRVKPLIEIFKQFEQQNDKFDRWNPNADIKVLIVTFVKEHLDDLDDCVHVPRLSAQNPDYITFRCKYGP